MDALRSRYARIERERRYLLDGPPDLPVARTLDIHDRYLRDTRLRLRSVTEHGRRPVHKLGQKIRVRADEPSTVEHTTTYLDAAEHAALRGLPADELVKTRLLLAGPGPTWAVDVFHGPLEGLVLAEIDLGDAAAPVGPAPPGGPVVEVTADERFTGGALARSGAADLWAAVAEVRGAGRDLPAQ